MGRQIMPFNEREKKRIFSLCFVKSALYCEEVCCRLEQDKNFVFVFFLKRREWYKRFVSLMAGIFKQHNAYLLLSTVDSFHLSLCAP